MPPTPQTVQAVLGNITTVFDATGEGLLESSKPALASMLDAGTLLSKWAMAHGSPNFQTILEVGRNASGTFLALADLTARQSPNIKKCWPSL